MTCNYLNSTGSTIGTYCGNPAVMSQGIKRRCAGCIDRNWPLQRWFCQRKLTRGFRKGQPCNKITIFSDSYCSRCRKDFPSILEQQNRCIPVRAPDHVPHNPIVQMDIQFTQEKLVPQTILKDLVFINGDDDGDICEKSKSSQTIPPVPPAPSVQPFGMRLIAGEGLIQETLGTKLIFDYVDQTANTHVNDDSSSSSHAQTWTKQDDKTIIDWYEGRPDLYEMSVQVMSRSWADIYHRLRELGRLQSTSSTSSTANVGIYEMLGYDD